MEQLLIYAVAGGISLIGSGGGAWIGLKVALNGTRDRVTRMESRQDGMDLKLDRIAESAARLEATIGR